MWCEHNISFANKGKNIWCVADKHLERLKVRVTNYQIRVVGPFQHQKAEKQQIIWLNIVAFLEINVRQWKFITHTEKKKIKQVFYPFKHVKFQQEKNSEFLPKCYKMALFALQFSKFFGEACPRTPPREVPPLAIALSVPEKNPTFSHLNGSTEEWEGY